MRRKRVVALPKPVEVNYKYAFNTPEEVRVLVRHYAEQMQYANSEEIFRYAERIKFLEAQLTMTKASKF